MLLIIFLCDFEYNLVRDTHQVLNLNSLRIFSTSVITYMQWTEIPLKYYIYILFELSFAVSVSLIFYL